MKYDTADLLRLPGQGEESADMLIKARANQLGGDFSIMEGEIGPKQLLVPHTHTHEEQAVFVITGTLAFEVGGEGGLVFEAPAGSYVIKPREVSHGFWNPTDETVRYIELSGRANFETFVDELSEDGKRAALTSSQKYGVKFHPEDVPRLLRTHGLTSVRTDSSGNGGGLMQTILSKLP